MLPPQPPPGTTNREVALVITADCEDPVERPIVPSALRVPISPFRIWDLSQLSSFPYQKPLLRKV